MRIQEHVNEVFGDRFFFDLLDFPRKPSEDDVKLKSGNMIFKKSIDTDSFPAKNGAKFDYGCETWDYTSNVCTTLAVPWIWGVCRGKLDGSKIDPVVGVECDASNGPTDYAYSLSTDSATITCVGEITTFGDLSCTCTA